MNDTNIIYHFKFNAVDKRTMMSVYSFERDNVLLFMTQHGFDIDKNLDNIFIEEYDYSNNQRYDDRFLKIVKLRSNNNKDTIYNIMTTDELLSSCAVKIGEELTDKSFFGNLLTFEKFPIFRIISELIEKIKYGVIMDYQIIHDNDEYQNDDIKEPDYDRYIIIDKLLDNALKTFGTSIDVVLDISIEGYVANFISII